MQSSENWKVPSIRQVLRVILCNYNFSSFSRMMLMNLKWVEIIFSFLSDSHPLDKHLTFIPFTLLFSNNQ